MDRKFLEYVLRFRNEASRGLKQVRRDFAGAEQASAKIAEQNAKAAQSFDSIRDHARTAAIGVAAFIASTAGITSAIRHFAQFDLGMRNIATLIPNQRDRVKELADGVRELALRYGSPHSGVVQTLYQGISAYGDSADSLDRLDSALQASIAGLSTQKEAMDLLISVTRAFGDTSAEAVAHVSDLAFVTVRWGVTTFPQLSSAIRATTGLAKGLNSELEDLFALFAAQTGVSGTPREVSTQIAAVFREFLAPTREMREILAELGYQTAQSLIGERGLVNSLFLVRDAAEAAGIQFRKLFDDALSIRFLSVLFSEEGERVTRHRLGLLQNAAGATQEAVGEVIDSVAIAQQRFNNVIEEVRISVGEFLEPVVLGILNPIISIGEEFSRLNDTVKGLIGTFLLLAPAVLAIGAVAATLKTAFSFFVGGALGQAVLSSIKAFLSFRAVIAGVALAVGGLTAAFRILSVAIVSNPIAAAVGAIGSLAIGYGVYKLAVDDAAESTEEFTRTLDDFYSTLDFGNRTIAFQELGSQLQQELITGTQAAIDQTRDRIASLGADAFSQNVVRAFREGLDPISSIGPSEVDDYFEVPTDRLAEFIKLQADLDALTVSFSKGLVSVEDYNAEFNKILNAGPLIRLHELGLSALAVDWLDARDAILLAGNAAVRFENQIAETTKSQGDSNAAQEERDRRINAGISALRQFATESDRSIARSEVSLQRFQQGLIRGDDFYARARAQIEDEYIADVERRLGASLHLEGLRQAALQDHADELERLVRLRESELRLQAQVNAAEGLSERIDQLRIEQSLLDEVIASFDNFDNDLVSGVGGEALRQVARFAQLGRSAGLDSEYLNSQLEEMIVLFGRIANTNNLVRGLTSFRESMVETLRQVRVEVSDLLFGISQSGDDVFDALVRDAFGGELPPEAFRAVDVWRQRFVSAFDARNTARSVSELRSEISDLSESLRNEIDVLVLTRQERERAIVARLKERGVIVAEEISDPEVRANLLEDLANLDALVIQRNTNLVANSLNDLARETNTRVAEINNSARQLALGDALVENANIDDLVRNLRDQGIEVTEEMQVIVDRLNARLARASEGLRDAQVFAELRNDLASISNSLREETEALTLNRREREEGIITRAREQAIASLGSVNPISLRAINDEIEALRRQQAERDDALDDTQTFIAGLRRFAQEAQEHALDSSDIAYDIAQRLSSGLAGATSDFLARGLQDFEDFRAGVAGVLRDISSQIFRFILQTRLITPLFGAFGFADGGVVGNGNILPFQRGGVVGGPVAFPLRNGNVGLAGESGPEAILPLDRGSDGRLGVRATGGGGTFVYNSSMTFHLGNAGADNGASDPETARRMSRVLDSAISDKVREVLLIESRPGGMISRRQ